MLHRNRSFGRVETLENRELLFASAFIDNGALVINADPWGGEVDTYGFYGSVLVASPNRTQVFSANALNRISFRGSNAADNFENHTSIPTRIHGNGGNDTLTGGSGNDKIYGHRGNDTINAGLGNDEIAGGRDNDRLSGGKGNDRYLFDIDSPLGRDTLNEGRGLAGLFGGRDTLDFSLGSTRINIDLDRSTWQTVHPNLAIELESSFTFENVVGTSGNDTIRGNPVNNRLVGGRGHDSLYGRGGNDTYVFDADGPLGTDTVGDWSGIDTLDFSQTNGRTIHCDLNVGVHQVNPNLRLRLDSVIDNAIGGGRNDVLIGTSSSNTIKGGPGNDTLRGMSGNDTLVGGRGNDILDGGAHGDRYVFDGSALGHDHVVDTHGVDTLDFTRHSGPIFVDLANHSRQTVRFGHLALTLSNHAQVENVIGTNYRDSITGNHQNNTIKGLGGSDTLIGLAGRDTIWGGAGIDFLYGGSGNDRLIGGSGTDHLYGGSEDDGLYGGSDHQRDYLYGDYGQDRFLTRSGDRMQDKRASDVQIQFVDGSSNWNDREIETVDKAFAQLQERVGSTRILDDPASTHPLEFTKVVRTGNVLGRNREWEFLFWFDRDIEIADWNENSNASNRDARATVIHEIAHNWDESAEQNPYWHSFSALHNVSNQDEDFAQHEAVDDDGDTYIYGTTNAKEDWATTWQAYFGYVGHGSSNIYQSKLHVAGAFFANLA